MSSSKTWDKHTDSVGISVNFTHQKAPFNIKFLGWDLLTDSADLLLYDQLKVNCLVDMSPLHWLHSPLALSCFRKEAIYHLQVVE